MTRERDVECWVPIAGFEGHYEVSDRGQVASLKFGRRRILSPKRQRSGHLGVGLCLKGEKTQWRVHRLVMASFVGPCPEGQEVRHLDGDPTNNALSNLVYGTVSENHRDAYRHGGRPTGQRSHLAKFSDVTIAQIRALKGSASSREVARLFGANDGYVRQLWRGSARAHDGLERAVEAHLVASVRAAGGEVRKLKWLGHNGAPDRVVMLPGGRVVFVEVKRPGRGATFPSNGHERRQAREHARMRRMGQRVVVIDSFAGVEELLS